MRTCVGGMLLNSATRTEVISPCWRHQMETFSALLAICAGNSPVTGEFTTQKPVTRSFYVFSDLRLNKRLSKTIVRLVIWDAIAPIMTSLQCCRIFLHHSLSDNKIGRSLMIDIQYIPKTIQIGRVLVCFVVVGINRSYPPADPFTNMD